MAIPQVNITVKNGGLGIAAANSEGIQAKVGRISAAEFGSITAESQLAVDTPTQFGSADAIQASCGAGALAQAAILALQQGGGPVVICRAGDGDFQTAVAAAVDALKASPLDFEMVHVVCDADMDSASSGFATTPLSDADAGALVTALDGKAADFWSAHRYDSAFFVIESMEATGSTTPSISATSDFVAVCPGFVTSTNPITGATQKNPLAWHATARAATVPAGRDLAATADGPLIGVSAVAHDEAAHGGACDTANLTTARTFPRHAGVYLTNARMLRSASSDLEFWQHRRVMNAACAAADDYLFTLLSSSIQVDASNGHIAESAATAIEANCQSAINDRVGQFVSEVSVTVDRTSNILSTKTIPVNVAIVPLGYVKAIEVTIGFKNPALTSE